ncbi:SRPBCC family protein [Actinocorallia lasiicapitis]
MATITVSADLTATPDEIWSALQDYDRYGEWLVVHDSFAPAPPAPPRPGDRFVQRGSLLGMRGELEWTFERLVPGREIVITAETPVNARLRVTFVLAPQGSGSRMTCRYELLGLRTAGLLARAARPEARKHTFASLNALDALAQARARPLEGWEQTG